MLITATTHRLYVSLLVRQSFSCSFHQRQLTAAAAAIGRRSLRMSSTTASSTQESSQVQNVERRLQHLFDGGDWNVYNPNVLNLGVGAPGSDLLENCCDIFRKATEHRLKYEQEHNRSLLFQYGPTSGTYEARSAIAKYFSGKYVKPMLSEDLIITSGATQGLHVILSTLIDLNGCIFVDEVTYMIALDAIKQFTTLTIVPVRLRDDGVDVDHLEQLLTERQFKSTTKEFWAMYYTIPAYHNPTGICFSDTVCRRLIQLARKHDVLVLCDDVYNILHYDEKQQGPQRLFAYDERTDGDYRGNVISNGSFSKLIGPGVRLGWLEVPPRVKPTLDASGVLNSGGCLNNYTAGVMASLFELGLAQAHIAAMYDAYKERMLSTCAALQEHLPDGCRMLTAPGGGYFIWVLLPETVDATELQKYCLAEGNIFFIPGARFAAQPSTARHCLRLSIAFHNRSRLLDGVKRLCGMLRAYLEKQK